MGKVEVNRSEIAQEVSDKQVPGAGLYRHPNGTEAITLYDPLFGNAQSEAFVRLGFEFVREVDASEIKSIVELNLQSRETPVVNQSVESAQAVAAEAKDKELEELRAYKAQKEAEEAEAADAAKKADEEAKAKADADAKAKADADKKAADEKAKADAAKKAADEKEGK